MPSSVCLLKAGAIRFLLGYDYDQKFGLSFDFQNLVYTLWGQPFGLHGALGIFKGQDYPGREEESRAPEAFPFETFLELGPITMDASPFVSLTYSGLNCAPANVLLDVQANTGIGNQYDAWLPVEVSWDDLLVRNNLAADKEVFWFHDYTVRLAFEDIVLGDSGAQPESGCTYGPNWYNLYVVGTYYDPKYGFVVVTTKREPGRWYPAGMPFGVPEFNFLPPSRGMMFGSANNTDCTFSSYLEATDNCTYKGYDIWVADNCTGPFRRVATGLSWMQTFFGWLMGTTGSTPAGDLE